jgi:hypothetical protein
MALFGRKTPPPPSSKPRIPDRPPIVTAQDIKNAQTLVDEWDVSLGTNARIWACLERIGKAGGYPGANALLDLQYQGYDADEVMQRPWRWLIAVSDASLASGDNVLPGRTFLLMYLFDSQMAQGMTMGDFLDTGMAKPARANQSALAQRAERALAILPQELVIHDSATGTVTAGMALAFARDVLASTT